MVEQITEDKYYERLFRVWNAMVDGTLEAKEWAAEYDICFKLCILGKEPMIYCAFKRLFDTVSKTNIDYQLYRKSADSMVRIGSFLNRFWIPRQKNLNPEHIGIYQLSELAWKQYH